MAFGCGVEALAIPGPTPLPDRVVRAMCRPSTDIYDGVSVKATEAVLTGVARVFRTESPVYIQIANGHGGWESALSNVFSRGERVLVLESGNYAVNWGRMAEAMGLAVEVVPGQPRGPVDLDAFEDRLRADREGAIKAVIVVQIDTASGVANDIPAVRAVLDRAGHGALLFVDAVASLGCVPFEMDAWGVDLAVGASQKGLMAPPGLAYVAAGPRALAAHAEAGLRTRYWDWTLRDAEPHYAKYCGTPPTHLLFAQAEALAMLFEEGLAAIFARHTALAQATRAAIAAWAEGCALEFFIRDAACRSDTVSTVMLSDGSSSEPLRTLCRQRYGLVLGVGQGETAEAKFRIAHMGHCSAPMLMGTLGTVQSALEHLGLPFGRDGVAAAASALAERLPTETAPA